LFARTEIDRLLSDLSAAWTVFDGRRHNVQTTVHWLPGALPDG